VSPEEDRQVLLEGRVALITGAGSGIGRAAARSLAAEGARIIALDRDQDSTRELVDELKGREVLPLAVDVADPGGMREAIEGAARQWGRIDIVFANAGINGVWAPLEELEPEDWEQTLAVNLRGTYLTVKYAVPSLKVRGGSVIINSSVNGTRMFSNTGATAYACAKAGQVAFAKMIALELAKHRVRVNVICPGWIETSIQESTEEHGLEGAREPVEFPEGAVPLTDGRPGSAEQVAALVLFLASDAASHITGTEIWIDGGQSLLQA
jgi:NAD(P)-dependent dehydrogenase (short-subunit alcohol dehydrogenase family)